MCKISMKICEISSQSFQSTANCFGSKTQIKMRVGWNLISNITRNVGSFIIIYFYWTNSTVISSILSLTQFWHIKINLSNGLRCTFTIMNMIIADQFFFLNYDRQYNPFIYVFRLKIKYVTFHSFCKFIF